MDRTELSAQLVDAVTRMADSDQWRHLISIRNFAHKYSLGNRLLIWAQCEEATTCAGLKAWNQVGRKVRKGQHGLVIFAPRTFTTEDEDGTKHRTLAGFRPTYTFDISQTEGPDLPEWPAVDAQAPADMWCILKGLSCQRGYDLQLVGPETLGSAKGSTSPKDKYIHVSSDLPTAEACSVLAHELIHTQGVDYEAFSRAEAELITETAAFLACSELGLDTLQHSAHYLTSWSTCDPKRVTAVLAEADRQAEKLIADAKETTVWHL